MIAAAVSLPVEEEFEPIKLATLKLPLIFLTGAGVAAANVLASASSRTGITVLSAAGVAVGLESAFSVSGLSTFPSVSFSVAGLSAAVVSAAGFSAAVVSGAGTLSTTVGAASDLSCVTFSGIVFVFDSLFSPEIIGSVFSSLEDWPAG